MMLYKKVVILVLCIFIATHGKSQYFQFSQKGFTPQRLNPAIVASSDYAHINFLHRNQSTGTDVKLATSYMSAIYPFIKPNKGKRWSGLGVSAMVDKSGIGGLYEVNEFSVSYAVNVFLSKTHSLSFGMNSKYHSGQFSLDKLTTGNQYVVGEGLLKGIPSGENFERFEKNYFALGMGVYWSNVDRDNIRLNHFGISVFDINKPNENFFEKSIKKLSTLVVEGGFQIMDKREFSLYPEFIWTHSAGVNDAIFGTVLNYYLNQYSRDYKLNFIAKYNLSKIAILGFQYQKEYLLIGVSYDFPIQNNVANHGAIELGIRYQKQVKSKRRFRKRRRKKRKEKGNSPRRINRRIPTSKGENSLLVVTADTLTIESQKDIIEDANEAEKSNGKTGFGDLSNEPFDYESNNLSFEFDFNKSTLSKEFQGYVRKLIRAMKKDNSLKVEITGHTDDLGHKAYNMKLSKKRANAIAIILAEGGISPNRITVLGKGELEPVNDNSSEEKRKENRRVELFFYRE